MPRLHALKNLVLELLGPSLTALKDEVDPLTVSPQMVEPWNDARCVRATEPV